MLFPFHLRTTGIDRVTRVEGSIDSYSLAREVSLHRPNHSDSSKKGFVHHRSSRFRTFLLPFPIPHIPNLIDPRKIVEERLVEERKKKKGNRSMKLIETCL